MSDKVHGGQSKTSKELFREGFKAFKEALKGAEGALAHQSSLEAEASELLGQTSPSLAELPKILFKLSQSTSVGAVITSATGSELMANNAFYNLTRGSGGAGGAATATTAPLKLRKSAQGDQVDPPWLRAPKASKAIFERLYCGEEGTSGQHLDFYCQPLLASGGVFEGAFTLVADSSEEVGRQEKLKELIIGAEGQIEGLKQAADEITQFLKTHGQTGALPISAAEDKSHTEEQPEHQPEHQPQHLSEIHSPVRTETPFASAPPVTLLPPVSPTIAAPPSPPAPPPGPPPQHQAPPAPPAPQQQVPTISPVSPVPPLLSPPDYSARSYSSRPDPILELQINKPAEEEAEFDPAQLQEAVESASAFILDQESTGFPEAADDDGPEDLWQEMSDGLAEVLNVEDSEASRSQDINMTILEEKPSRVRAVSADKNIEPVFLNDNGEAAACLVVDDIPVNQKLLVFQLKHFGLHIDTASSGSEALALIAKNDYQIVFMDCDMPRMSGYDTTAEVRRREMPGAPKLPIIGMTSHDRDGDKQKCLRSGMNDALPKGVSESELGKTIAAALGVAEADKPADSQEPERTFDPQELEELISTFLYAMEMFVSSMQRAIDEKDSSLVRELASSVSGPSRVLGLHDMKKVSEEMVRLSSSGDWPQVRLKYLKLKTVYMRCQEDLRKLCPQAFSQVSATH